MCGRYRLTATSDEVQRLFDVSDVPELPPRRNIAPTQQVLFIHMEDDARHAELGRWGLMPAWVKDPTSFKGSLFNARAETVHEKASFKTPFKRRRCLIPANGYYEWRSEPGGKQPYEFTVGDAAGESLFAMAGLYDIWRPKKNDDRTTIVSCTILTTTSNSLAEQVHTRMPVIVSPEDYGVWLEPTTPPTHVQALLQSFDSNAMSMTAVSKEINAVGKIV
ncbi:MAG: SOS response-associated peptidase [Deinococcota bacterium]